MKRRSAVAGLLGAAALALAPHGCARAPKPASPAEPPPAVATAPGPVRPDEPLEPVEPVPATPPAFEPSPAATVPSPGPSSAPAAAALPDRVRIGLATDLESVTLPCCDGTVLAEVPGALDPAAAPLVVRPAARAVAASVWRLQAAALRDESAARGLAGRLEAHTGERARFAFDAAAGLYRVRLGGWPRREDAEGALRRLRGVGLEGAWVVSEGGGLTEPALELEQQGRRFRVPGRRFRIRSGRGDAVRIDGRWYRGTIEVYLNDRGRLNLVNELGLEEYLRGVVPRELGPGQYGELEALKAQAVAARSYTLRNLGGFAAEGYDLCARPQCQVYGGRDDEHPLSDRAVAETAGEVALYDGEPVDALYTATCGGHTENIEVVFPLRTADYLRGVPCVEAGGARLRGSATAAGPLEAALAARIGGAGASTADAAALGAALGRVVRAAGLEPPPDRLRDLAPGEVRRFLASQLDLASDPRLFARAGDLESLAAHPPGDWREPERRFAAWLAATGLLDPDRREPLSPAEARTLVGQVALYLGVVAEERGRFVVLAGERLRIRALEGERELALASPLATYRLRGGTPERADLLLLPGDPVRLVVAGDRVAAVVQEEPPRAASGPLRNHERSSWSRFRAEDELARMVRARYPGFALADFEIVARGVSGRVGRLRLRATGGETVEVEGLAVRWLLELPDTLFTVRRASSEGGTAGWRFTGRGWGHGVGMCQTGAFGMARRGFGYRDILGHYYTGVTIERLPPAVP